MSWPRMQKYLQRVIHVCFMVAQGPVRRRQDCLEIDSLMIKLISFSQQREQFVEVCVKQFVEVCVTKLF